MDLELNSEGGSGGPTSVCSDQLFDACGAEPVLDLPHGGVLGRAQPRTSSIAQLSQRLRARQKVRVEMRKLHQYVWAGQRHPSRRPGSSRCGTVASRGDGASSRRAPRCRISRGASRCCPQAVAVAAWAEDVEPAAPVDAIDRAQQLPNRNLQRERLALQVAKATVGQSLFARPYDVACVDNRPAPLVSLGQAGPILSSAWRWRQPVRNWLRPGPANWS